MNNSQILKEIKNLLDAIRRKDEEGLSKDTLYEGLATDLGQDVADEVYAVLEKHEFPGGSEVLVEMILSKGINLDDLKTAVAKLEKQSKSAKRAL